MPNIITQIEIGLPDHLKSIDEQSFWKYLMWQDGKKELSRRIISKFRSSALSSPGYNDEIRPDKRVQDQKKIGELEFLITTEPTTKTPSYSGVNEEFGAFLDHLEEQYIKGLLKKGYKTIDGKFFVDLSVLKDKIESELKASLEGKEGIKQGITLMRPSDLITYFPERVPIVLENRYEALSEYNGRMFVMAENMISEGNRRTDGYAVDGNEIMMFKRLLLKDSLERIGDYRIKVPKAVGYAFEQFTFVHQLEPRERIAYASIVNSFIRQSPKKITRKSKIGDFSIIKAMLDGESTKAQFSGLGLIDGEFIKDYAAFRQDGTNYVRLHGVKDRLKKYRADFTKLYIEQNLSVKLTTI
jgi:hypothetical protein